MFTKPTGRRPASPLFAFVSAACGVIVLASLLFVKFYLQKDFLLDSTPQLARKEFRVLEEDNFQVCYTAPL